MKIKIIFKKFGGINFDTVKKSFYEDRVIPNDCNEIFSSKERRSLAAWE